MVEPSMPAYLPTNHAYNLGQLHPRDMAARHYDSDLFRTLRIQRVFVIDTLARVALLTTPMRVISVWHNRESQWAGQQQLSVPTSYTSLSGVQPPVLEETAQRYLNILARARQGTTVLSNEGNVTFHALRITNAQGLVTGANQLEVLQPEPLQSALWLKMFVQNFGTGFADVAYIADSIGFERPSDESSTSAQSPPPFVLLVKECESDAAMGSAVRLPPDENGIVIEGMQFRNGFGAVWDASSQFAELQFPLYSPFHLTASEVNPERLWAFSE